MNLAKFCNYFLAVEVRRKVDHILSAYEDLDYLPVSEAHFSSPFALLTPHFSFNTPGVWDSDSFYRKWVNGVCRLIARET